MLEKLRDNISYEVYPRIIASHLLNKYLRIVYVILIIFYHVWAVGTYVSRYVITIKR